MSKKQTSTSQPEIFDCWNRIGVWGKQKDRCPRLTAAIHCRNCAVFSTVGRQLLNRPAPPDYQQEWTNILAAEENTGLPKNKSAFVFRAGGEWLAMAASVVEEVLDMGTIHSIPHLSNNQLRGLVNIRGKLEVCVSIGAVLGIERYEQFSAATSYISPERLVVVSYLKQIITFPVSEVMGVVRYHDGMVKDSPVTVSGSKAVYTRGILSLENMDAGFLREEPLFQALTKGLR